MRHHLFELKFVLNCTRRFHKAYIIEGPTKIRQARKLCMNIIIVLSKIQHNHTMFFFTIELFECGMKNKIDNHNNCSLNKCLQSMHADNCEKNKIDAFCRVANVTSVNIRTDISNSNRSRLAYS